MSGRHVAPGTTYAAVAELEAAWRSVGRALLESPPLAWLARKLAR